MSEKLELEGIVTLGLAVKTADGLLDKGDWVKITAANEIGLVTSASDFVLGFILVPNKETNGIATVATRFKRVVALTSGGAFTAGDYVNVNGSNKIIKAAPGGVKASATITIVDYSIIDNTDKVTINGVDVVAGGTDFAAATSNDVTAKNLAIAINAKVPGVRAYATAAVVTVQSDAPGAAGNSITLTTNADAGEMTVSAATLSGGLDFNPMGVALETASGADQSKIIGCF